MFHSALWKNQSFFENVVTISETWAFHNDKEMKDRLQGKAKPTAGNNTCFSASLYHRVIH